MLFYSSVEIKMHIMLCNWMQYKLKPVSASMQLKLTKAVVTKVFIKDISLYKQYDISESVCLFVCVFPNSSKTANSNKLKFEGWFPLGCRRFRLKNIQICQTVSRKIACIVGMYTSNPSSQFYSLQYESSMYLQGW